MTWVIISHLLCIWKIRPQLIQLEYVLKPCECLYRSKPSRQYSVRETVVENWLKICISFEYIKWNSRLIVYDLLGFLWGHKSRGNLGIGIFYKPNIGRVSVPLKKPLEVNFRGSYYLADSRSPHADPTDSQRTPYFWLICGLP